MFQLRNALRRAAVQVDSIISVKAGREHSRASISTGPQQQHETFYEFRTYYIKPHLNAAFHKLTSEKIHLRTAHSELLGYWSVEYGGLNQVFHIWKYDSYAQRAAVRAALAQDANWMEQYISKAIPMLSSQDNEVTYLVPWSKIQKPPKEGGVYELVSFQMKPGGPAVWGPSFQAAVSTHAAPGYAYPVGVFHSEFGVLNRLHVLWWYEGADDRAAVRHKAHSDARVVSAALQFPFTGTKRPCALFQHDDTPVPEAPELHEDMVRYCWTERTLVLLKSLDFIPTEHLWDELEH